VPALVMVGENDRMTPPAAAVALAADLPQARLEVLEGAGHFPMMEEHEEFNRRLEAFAREVLGRRPGKRRSP
jgi:3-oxoadipate enol-lactonase